MDFAFKKVRNADNDVVVDVPVDALVDRSYSKYFRLATISL